MSVGVFKNDLQELEEREEEDLLDFISEGTPSRKRKNMTVRDLTHADCSVFCQAFLMVFGF